MTEPSRRLPRPTTLASVALWVVLLLVAAFVAFTLNAVESSNHRLQQHVDAQDTVITRLATGLDTTRRQLQQHHVTPKAPAASSIVRGVQGVPGVPGPAGPSGVAGSPGPSGAPGRNGSAGVAGSPGPAGPSGAPGATGSPGAAGQTGPAGPAGPKGDTGPTGRPPSGWTFTYNPPVGPSQTYNCTPDSEGSTHYACAPTSGTGPLKSKNSPARSVLSLGGLLAMAAYRRLDPTGRHTD